jgi:hypothetical protein
VSAAQTPAHAEFGVGPVAVPSYRAAHVIAPVVVLPALIVRAGFQLTDIFIVFNGEPLADPETLAVEGWAPLAAVVALFCAATRRLHAVH